jgi:hypothetical protein
MNKMTEPASSAPIAMLKMHAARSPWSSRCTPAPNASQTKQLGKAARINSRPKDAA